VSVKPVGIFGIAVAAGDASDSDEVWRALLAGEELEAPTAPLGAAEFAGLISKLLTAALPSSGGPNARAKRLLLVEWVGDACSYEAILEVEARTLGLDLSYMAPPDDTAPLRLLRQCIASLDGDPDLEAVLGLAVGANGVAVCIAVCDAARFGGPRPYARVLGEADASAVSLWLTTPALGATLDEALAAAAGDADAAPCAVLSPGGRLSEPLRSALALAVGVMALRYMVLPPGPAPDALAGRFYQNKAPRPWFPFKRGLPLAAAVGAAGARPALALERAEEPAQGAPLWPEVRGAYTTSELLTVGAGTRAELVEKLVALRSRLETPGGAAPDVRALGSGRFRAAVVGTDRRHLVEQLTQAQKVIARGSDSHFGRDGVFFADSDLFCDGRVAFLYPGQGSAYPGMLADICCQFPSARRWFESMDAGADGREPPTRWLFSHLAASPGGRRRLAEVINAPELGAPAGFVASMALDELVRKMGVSPDVLVGYSNGELVALTLAGALPLRDREQLFEWAEQLRDDAVVAERSGRLPTGTLLSVSALALSEVSAVVEQHPGRAFVAMDNCPSQVTVITTAEVGDAVADELSRRGGLCLRLPLGRAYHTPLFAKQAAKIRDLYESLGLGAPEFPVYSCASAAPFGGDRESVLDLASRQWESCVRFRETVERLYADGVRLFVEIGAASVLTGFVKDTLRKRPHVAVASDVEGRNGAAQLQTVAAHLFVCGREVDGDVFHPARSQDAAGVSRAPANAPHAAEGRAPAVAPEPKREAGPFKPLHPAPTANLPEAVPATAASVVRAHFQLMDEFLATQGRVLAATVGRLRLKAAAPGGAAPNLSGNLTRAFERPAPAATPERAAGAGQGRRYPLLGGAVGRTETSIEFERAFSLASDPYLRDHTLGRVDARSPHTALPVLPFTIAMELMAEAACALTGNDAAALAIHEIRAYRWLAVNLDEMVLRVVAVKRPPAAQGGQLVDVSVYELKPRAGGSGREALRAFKCAVEFSEAPEQGVPLVPGRTGDFSKTRFSGKEFYGRCVFHGPSFQSIRSPRYLDERGIEVEVRVPAAGDGELITPAFLLDAIGQAAAYWMVEYGHRFFGEYPFQMKRYQQLRPPPRAHEKLVCRLSCRFNGMTTSADAELVDEKGRPVARVEQLLLRHYQFDRRLLSSLYWPGPAALLSEEGESEGEPDVIVRRISRLPQDMLGASQDIWLRALAHTALVDEERRAWYALPEQGLRRLEWLLGRIAAKDAVRVWAARNLGAELSPHQLVIRYDERGAPTACVEGVSPAPRISISHSDGRALAAASGHRLVGVDLERRGAHKLEHIGSAFDAEELGLWPAPLGPPLPLWCAREAAAKASGRGIGGDWLDWRIHEVSPDGRHVVVGHGGEAYAVRLTNTEDECAAVCIH